MVRVSDAARDGLPAFRVRWARLEHVGEPDRPAPEEGRFRVGERSPEEIKADPVAQAYRSFFWDVDVDPTKRRPAGEALARRRASGGLPSIHPLVDAYNQASAATLVALSAFDEQAVAGGVILDVAREGEALDALGEDEPVEPTGTHPVWRDEEGLVGLAGYRDARRTALGPDTEQALVVALVPDAVEAYRVGEAFDRLRQRAEAAGWRVVEQG